VSGIAVLLLLEPPTMQHTTVQCKALRSTAQRIHATCLGLPPDVAVPIVVIRWIVCVVQRVIDHVRVVAAAHVLVELELQNLFKR
jgi:hypothetical protein